MAAKVNCPVCKKEVEWIGESPYRPFCSERCKQIDLGAWADEKYTVPLVEKIEHSEEGSLS